MTRAANPSEPVSLTLVLTEPMAALLADNKAPASQFDVTELETYDLGLPDPTDARFDDGTLFWCRSVSDMFLLRAYEEAAGHVTTLLVDPLAENHEPSRVVLSARTYR